jgi:hypothetical protein
MKSMSRILETEGSVAWPPARFCVTNKPWGRPRTTGIGHSNRDEMAETELAMIGEWRRKQLDLPSRTAAIRQLVTAMLHLFAKDPDEKLRRSEAVGVLHSLAYSSRRSTLRGARWFDRARSTEGPPVRWFRPRIGSTACAESRWRHCLVKTGQSRSRRLGPAGSFGPNWRHPR